MDGANVRLGRDKYSKSISWSRKAATDDVLHKLEMSNDIEFMVKLARIRKEYTLNSLEQTKMEQCVWNSKLTRRLEKEAEYFWIIVIITDVETWFI